MTSDLQLDLEKLKGLAFNRAEWAEEALKRYHIVIGTLGQVEKGFMQVLHAWMFVPVTLWPFNIQDVLEACLEVLENGTSLTEQQRIIIELLPVPPNEGICAAVTEHELCVQTGKYEHLVNTPAKYAQNKVAIKTDFGLTKQWEQLKAVFDVKAYQDYKGLIRRTMIVERNLRPAFAVKMNRDQDVFQAAFDAFCLRWNLYGMQHDEPLPLKLTVNLNAFGTMIHIPSYWSFDPKRDICWNTLAKLHRVRVPHRQGKALAEGQAERRKLAKKLQDLDAQAIQLKLKGRKKHEFLCNGLGMVPETDPKRLRLLRKEFGGRKEV